MKKCVLLITAIPLLLAAIWLLGCKSKAKTPLATVPSVDIYRYLGTWYEIARYPNWFEKDCVGVTASYSLRQDGMIRVYNHARLHSLNGKENSVTGKAKIADKTTRAKLLVSFFGPFYADYWIIALGEQYDYAVVSEPSRKYLWILCRTPQMEVSQYQKLLVFLKDNSFDTSKLILIPQAQPKP